jgi:DNA-binding MarR family transcriptional regulator
MARKLDTHEVVAHASASSELALPYDNAVLSAVVRIVSAFTAAPLQEQFAVRAGIPANSKIVAALFTLSSAGPMRPSILAARLDISLAGTSRILDSLAEAALAIRTPDINDARATIVTLTPEGRAAARELFRHGDLMMHELMRGWSTKDSTQLGLLLTRFADAVTASGTNDTSTNTNTNTNTAN